jgi:hypothetical protein
MTAEAAAAALMAMVRTKSTIDAPIGRNAPASPNASPVGTSSVRRAELSH